MPAGDGQTQNEEEFIHLKKLALDYLFNTLGMPNPSNLIQKWVHYLKINAPLENICVISSRDYVCP